MSVCGCVCVNFCGQRVDLIECFQVWLLIIPPVAATPPIKKQSLFPLPLDLGWPYDFLWPREYNESDILGVSNPGFKRPCSFCLLPFGIQSLCKKGWAGPLNDEQSHEEREPPAISFPWAEVTDVWVKPLRHSSPGHTHSWIQSHAWPQLTSWGSRRTIQLCPSQIEEMGENKWWLFF